METSLNKYLRKTIEYLGYIFVFILPWQTKLILRSGETNYLEISLYFSQFILLIILILFLVFRLKDSRYNYNHRSLVYSLTALELFIFISIFFAPDKLLAFAHYFLFLLSFSLFFVIRLGTEPKNYQETIFKKINLIYIFLASVFFQSCLGIYQFLTQSAFACKYLGLAAHTPDSFGTAVVETASGRWLRAYGGLDHPNILGGVLAISLILAAYLLAKNKVLNTTKQLWASISLFIFYFISLEALFFTFSRAAWLALAVGLLSLLIIFIISRDKWVIGRFVVLLFFSFLLLVTVAIPFRELVMVRIQSSLRLEQKSINERIFYNLQAQDLIRNNFLFGVGVGNYSKSVMVNDQNEKAAWDYQPVHNAWLLFLAENGIFSFLSFLVFFFFLVKNGRRENFSLAIIITFVILMLLDHWLISLPFGLLFFFLFLGLI